MSRGKIKNDIIHQMSILKIAQTGNLILLQKASPLSLEEIKSNLIQELINSMIETLEDEGGVGLAAPQIFKSKRIIIIHSQPTKKAFRKTKIPLTIIINPQIIYTSPVIELDWEGCLSFSKGNLLGLVPRSKRIRLTGLDRNGNNINITASSFKARVIQHEIDHLEGMLFIQRMRKKDLKYISHRKEWLKFHSQNWLKPRLL